MLIAILSMLTLASADDLGNCPPGTEQNSVHEVAPQVANVSAEFRKSYIWAMNETQIGNLQEERKKNPDQEYWIAVVPGQSEQWGHHKASPGAVESSVGGIETPAGDYDDPETGTPRARKVSDNFRDRLDRAHKLLEAGIVKYIFVTGGSIDDQANDYNEAIRGQNYLLHNHGKGDKRAGLRGRVIIDAGAKTTPANILNADKFCYELGIDRYILVTDMPSDPDRWLPTFGLTSQGFYLLHPTLTGLHRRQKKMFGITLGEFKWMYIGLGGEDSDTVLTHDSILKRHELKSQEFRF